MKISKHYLDPLQQEVRVGDTVLAATIIKNRLATCTVTKITSKRVWLEISGCQVSAYYKNTIKLDNPERKRVVAKDCDMFGEPLHDDDLVAYSYTRLHLFCFTLEYAKIHNFNASRCYRISDDIALTFKTLIKLSQD